MMKNRKKDKNEVKWLRPMVKRFTKYALLAILISSGVAILMGKPFQDMALLGVIIYFILYLLKA